MRRAFGNTWTRVLAVGVAAAFFVGVVGFWWFVAISWGVLRRSIGLAPLVLLLVVVAAVTAAWAPILVTRAVRPGAAISRRRKVGVAAVTLLAALTGLVAVPATRTRLERNKCARVAAADAVSQARCRTWLESRRQWWTLGLSHEDPAGR